MTHRRDFLRLAVFGAAGASALPSVADARTTAAPGDAGRALVDTGAGDLPVQAGWLLAPLQLGSPLGLGWRLIRAFAPVDGAITVNLAHDDGRILRVDLCLLDGAPRGPASTELVDFIVMDGGDGKAPMDESVGRALRRLAAIVADNEARDFAVVGTVAAEFQSHATRRSLHAGTMDRAAKRLAPGA
jgi:hypothetical protein